MSDADFKLRAALHALRREYVQRAIWAENYEAWGERGNAAVERARAAAIGRRIDEIERSLNDLPPELSP